MKHRRVVITRKGGPEVLKVVEEEIPSPKAGEVRIKVSAAGVAFVDTMLRAGVFPGAPRIPFSPGYDIVGTVDEAGAGVSGLERGQMVAALIKFGGYAEYICLPGDRLVPVPAGLDPEEAVCLVLNYSTAYQMLHRAARVKPGERILVHGAGGGVGTALLQLGNLTGLEIYGTASGPKHDLVSGLGATPIDYRSEDFVQFILGRTEQGVDAVFDAVGPRNWKRSYKTLRTGGRLVAYGITSFAAEGMFKIILGMIWLKLKNALPGGRSLTFFALGSRKFGGYGSVKEDLSKLFGLLQEEKIKPVIAMRLPLEEAARAHDLIGRAAVQGKIILLPGASRSD